MPLKMSESVLLGAVGHTGSFFIEEVKTIVNHYKRSEDSESGHGNERSNAGASR